LTSAPEPRRWVAREDGRRLAQEIVIEPPRGLMGVDWRELHQFRDLFFALAWRDISVRYKQTLLGVLWAVAQPVVNMVVFTFVFHGLGKLESGDGTPYPVFLYVGLLFWQFFAGTLSNTSASMVGNAGMIQKIYFPRLLLPAATVAVGLVDFAVAGCVLTALMAYFRVVPRAAGLAVLPLLVFAAALVSLGWGLFLAAVNVKYRDVRYALPFVIQILMYVTPIVYPVQMLARYPGLSAAMRWINPISGVIECARAALLGAAPVPWDALGISLLSGSVYLALGTLYFRRTEHYFADIA
jgi:lipopolysaccharide transport system permease protein